MLAKEKILFLLIKDDTVAVPVTECMIPTTEAVVVALVLAPAQFRFLMVLPEITAAPIVFWIPKSKAPVLVLLFVIGEDAFPIWLLVIVLTGAPFEVDVRIAVNLIPPVAWLFDTVILPI